MTRPTRTRHTAASTVRLPSGTAVTTGLPSAVVAGSTGAEPTSSDCSSPAASRQRRCPDGSSLRIHEADANQRYAEVAGLLQ